VVIQPIFIHVGTFHSDRAGSEEKDKATQDFLWGFVREQVEEEATAKNIVEKLKLYGEHHAVLMDHRLGKR